jgi:transcriptional regulator with XRE-family HTH domain
MNKQIGLKIRQLREDAGLSQDELAKQLNISRPSVSQIENGERHVTADEVVALTRVFNVDADSILSLKKEPQVILEKEGAMPTQPKEEIRISVPRRNVKKFKEVLLYILNKVGAKPNIGETVLYKLLYFIDFNFYEKYETQLIGATYIKNHHGPSPVEFAKIVGTMLDKDLVMVRTKHFNYLQKKYLPLRTADTSALNGTEIETIDHVLNQLSDLNATQIADYSHHDVPWMTAEDGKKIDYESVFYRTPAYSVREYGDKD